MSKNHSAAEAQRRRDRAARRRVEAAKQGRVTVAMRRDAANAMLAIASASVNAHADAMENAAIAAKDAAGVPPYVEDYRTLATVLTAQLDEQAPADPRSLVAALDEVLAHKATIEALTGDRLYV